MIFKIPTDEKLQTFSILEDALNILNNLQRQAKKMEGVTDLGHEPWYGTSNEDERKYKITREVSLTFAETKLSKERFYAATDLIDAAFSIYVNDNKKSRLEYSLRNGEECIAIRADYNCHKFQRSDKIRVAPISKVSFEQLKNAVKEILNNVLSGWKPDPDNEDRLIKEFVNYESDYTKIHLNLDIQRNGYLMFSLQSDKIEKIYKNFDKEFAFREHILKINNVSTYSVDKAQLEKAKKLFGYPTISKNNIFKEEKRSQKSDEKQTQTEKNMKVANPPGGLAFG